MGHTLGRKDCPKCKGAGVLDGETRTIVRQDGTELKYPTVYRCSCLEAKPEASPVDPGSGKAKPDAQSRAAGEKE